MKHAALALAFALTAALGISAPVEAARPKTYSVILEVQTDAENKVKSVTVSKVIDVCSGSTAAVNVPAPESFVNAARAQIAAKPGLPADGKFYTYFFFDPTRPDRTDLMPAGC